MARKPKTVSNDQPETKAKSDKPVSLGLILSKRPDFEKFRVWLVGDTPLITHAWSEKARREMLQKQVKATKAGREERKPEEDFQSSLYEMGKDARTKKAAYGFPVTGVKNAILNSAHKDKGIARSNVMAALWLNGDMVRVRPALAGAICDVPLVRIWGTDPENREDMVKIGSGLNKTANLAYRGQFTIWAINISGEFNSSTITRENLAFLIEDAGKASGLGEWRNERRGMFGAFHLANEVEAQAWERFAQGKGPMPVKISERFAEAAE